MRLRSPQESGGHPRLVYALLVILSSIKGRLPARPISNRAAARFTITTEQPYQELSSSRSRLTGFLYTAKHALPPYILIRQQHQTKNRPMQVGFLFDTQHSQSPAVSTIRARRPRLVHGHRAAGVTRLAPIRNRLQRVGRWRLFRKTNVVFDLSAARPFWRHR